MTWCATLIHGRMSHSLDIWLDGTLIPYLVQQLGQHPRFKGQPVLLVRMQGDNVQPHIDDLTDQIRQKIIDALLKQPGSIFPGDRPCIPWKHHRSLEEVSCGDFRQDSLLCRYRLRADEDGTSPLCKGTGIESCRAKMGIRFRQILAGNTDCGAESALDREHPDDHLRGLRPLPFSDRQPDLLAAYLARNLSCLLRQGEEDDPVVYVENVAVNTPNVFRTTLELVENTWRDSRQVEVTDDPKQANVTRGQRDPFHPSKPAPGLGGGQTPSRGKYLPGAETEAYVLIDAPKSKQPSPATIRQSPAEPIRPLAAGSGPRFDFIIWIAHAFEPGVLCTTDTPWVPVCGGWNPVNTSPRAAVWRWKSVFQQRPTFFWWARMPTAN